MSKQIIITVDREYGSGGKYIAKELAKHYDIPIYHHDLVKQLKGADVEELQKYDETGKIFGLSRTVRGHSSSIEEALTRKQFEFLKEKADNGDSFVVVGHCGDVLLKDCPGIIRLFMVADEEDKIMRTMEREHTNRKEALSLMKTYDRKRSRYYKLNTSNKWGDSKNYDMVVNTTAIGLDETIEVLYDFIDRKIKQL